MGSLDNNIRLIRNETVEGGNTKERIAETFDNIVAELGKKVDKVAGKILSSNDFTNELRQKLEGLQQVDTSGLLPKGGYTGTAQDLKNLIDAINRILQSNDTDLDQLQEIVTYIKQNKHILSTLGISNIAGLVEALAAKAEKDHNHDDRYAPITHHHNQYAHRTHRHNWDDIGGKPNNLATTENIKTAVEGIQIGGRNYVLDSKTSRSRRGEYIEYKLSKTLERGKYIASVDVSITKNTGFLGIIPATIGKKSTYPIVSVPTQGNKRYFFEIEITGDDVNAITLYPQKQYVASTSPSAGEATFSNFKLEKGNRATDWTPAPEDLELWTKQQHSLYGEIHHSDKPIVTKEVFLDSPNSKTNVYTENNELHVGSKKNGYTKVVAAGFKIPGKTDGDIPLAGGGTLTTQQLLGRVVGVEVSSNWTAGASWQNNTIFIKSAVTIELNQLQHLSSISFRKVFDTGTITFTCEEKTIKYTTDNIFNGKDGSTAVVSIYKNTCYIDIRNI